MENYLSFNYSNSVVWRSPLTNDDSDQLLVEVRWINDTSITDMRNSRTLYCQLSITRDRSLEYDENFIKHLHLLVTHCAKWTQVLCLNSKCECVQRLTAHAHSRAMNAKTVNSLDTKNSEQPGMHSPFEQDAKKFSNTLNSYHIFARNQLRHRSIGCVWRTSRFTMHCCSCWTEQSASLHRLRFECMMIGLCALHQLLAVQSTAFLSWYCNGFRRRSLH